MGDSTDQPKTLLAWLDDSSVTNEEIDPLQKFFSDHDSQFRMLTSEDQFKEYHESLPADARIKLIISGKLGEKLVPTIHESPKIVDIYVYCLQKEYHQKWAKNFSKVKDVETDSNVLKQIFTPCQKTKYPSIVRIAPKDDTPDDKEEEKTTVSTPLAQMQSQYELDSCYMISDVCFDCIARMKMFAKDKDDFIAFCQEAFHGNPEQAAIIQGIQDNYSAGTVVSWLTLNSLFLDMINHAFRALYVGGMFGLRLLIHDGYRKFEESKSGTAMHVYKGLSMENEQLEQWKNQKGKIISIKEFCSTSTNRDDALAYCVSSDTSKGVLFDIEADPQTEGVKPFASVSALTGGDDSDEVWFMIGSLFKIEEVLDGQDGVVTVKMTLCAADPANKTHALFEESKKRFLDSNGEIDGLRFGQLLVDLGRSLRDTNVCKNGEDIIRSHLDGLTPNHPDHLVCYDVLGHIALDEQRFDESLDWYQRFLGMKESINDERNSTLTEKCQQLAAIYLEKKENTLALNYFKHHSELIKQSHGDDHVCLIGCYFEVALIHELDGRLSQAVSYYYKILSIMELHSSIPSKDYAAVYNNLGSINTQLERYELALGFYQASLKIKLESGTPNLQSTAVTYKNIGIVHDYMSNTKEARSNYEKAAEIYRQGSPSDDACVFEMQGLIEALPADS